MDVDQGKNEFQGDTDEQGVISYDVVCTGADGEIFLVEIQRQDHRNFKERGVFYASRLINDQAPKDQIKIWDYDLKKVYVIFILNFKLPGTPGDEHWHNMCLCNKLTGDIFYDKLNFIYIELPKFVLTESELKTDLQMWLYSLKHTGTMTSLPEYAIGHPILSSFFSTAEYAKLSKEEKKEND